jgi:hypothetical protein
MADRYIVNNDGANSAVIDSITGVIVFSGPYDRAVSQAAEINRQASEAYNQNTTVKPSATTPTTTPLTSDEKANAATATVPANNNASVASSNTSEDAATANPVSSSTPVSKQIKDQIPLDNPLHDYDSYTYGLSLHMLHPADYDSLISDPARRYIPGNVLISSAGKYNSSFVRNPAFTEDFYFDNFKMTSYINVGHRNRNSNLVESTFTIIEPNGFTFINRLVQAAEQMGQGAGLGNYLKLPYVMQIDFYGYVDGAIAGAPIPNMTKIIPIMMIEMKSRVTSRGTEYVIRAVPYNHVAFSSDMAVSKADFLIKSKTVSDVFGTGAITASNAFIDLEEIKNLERQESDLEKRIAAATSDTVRENLLQQQSTIKNTLASKGRQFQVSGFADALNSWWDELRKRGETFAVNKIEVRFDPTIGNSDLIPTVDSPVTVQQAAAGGNNTQDQKAALQTAGGQSKGKIDFNSVSMTVPAGTSILKLIDWSVRNSRYIGSQLKDPTAAISLDPTANNASQLSAPLQWYRVVPEIKIDAYDPSTNLYTMSVVYYVTPWTVSSKHPMGPLGKTNGYSKIYNYLYTGQNKDILDMQIDFNLLYTLQMTSNRNKGKSLQTAPIKGDEQQMRGEMDNNPNTATDVQQTGPVVVPQSKLQPLAVVYGSNNTKYATRSGGEQAAAVTAGDISEALMVDTRGDMVSLKLRILGDPHFIKQDDIFYNYATAQNNSQLTPNNSLWTDNGELYVFVNFKTPVDYDESTGLAIPGANNSYTYSHWTGIYKLLTVESEFTKGKFEQVLSLARLPLSDADFTVGSNAQQRVDAIKLINLGNSGSFAASRFTGPLILQNNVQSGLPAYNQPADALQSGASAVQAIFKAAVSKAVGDAVGQVTKKITNSVKETISPYTDSLEASFNEWKGDFMIKDQLPAVEEVPPLSDAEVSSLFADMPDYVNLPETSSPPTDLGEFNG